MSMRDRGSPCRRERRRVRVPRRPAGRAAGASASTASPTRAHTWRHLLPRLADGGYRAGRTVHAWLRADRGARRRPLPDGRARRRRHRAARGARRRQARGDHRPRLGRVATYGAAGHEPERWAQVVAHGGAAGRRVAGVPHEHRAAEAQLVHVLLPAPAGRLVVAANDLAFIDVLWADWSPGYDAAERHRARQGRLARPGATCRPRSATTAATLGNGRRDPALDDVQAATQAGPDPADALPARPRRRLHRRRGRGGAARA